MSEKVLSEKDIWLKEQILKEYGQSMIDALESLDDDDDKELELDKEPWPNIEKDFLTHGTRFVIEKGEIRKVGDI